MQDAGFELEAYLVRIGLHPAPSGSPDLDLLRAVVARHAAAIPFESIDPFLGRGVPIDLGSVADKLVRRRRGGYCFEQNLLLRAALTALGFDVTPRLARVVRGRGDDAMTPRTHVMLRVELAEGAFLADVGFGNLTPTAPLAFGGGALIPAGGTGAQPTGHEPFQIVPLGSEWLVRAMLAGAWQTLYRIGSETPAPADLEVANWFTATHPASPFTGNLIIARPAPGERRTLFNHRFAVRDAAGVRVRHLDNEADLRAVLTDAFDLAVPPEDLATMAAAIAGKPEDQRFQGYFS